VLGNLNRAKSRHLPGQPWTLRTALLLAFADTTKPLHRRNGLVVLANAKEGAVPGLIPGFGFHSLRYHDISKFWHITS
jgi:hypothetical protein